MGGSFLAAVRVVSKPPAAARFAGVGAAFAAIAQRCATNKLAGVVALIRGLFAAGNALTFQVLNTQIAIACRLTMASPSHAIGALTHFPLL